MKNVIVVGVLILIGVGLAAARQSNNSSDEGGRVLALEKVWNRALKEKGVNALDMLLAKAMVSVDIDGSLQNKGNFLQASSSGLSGFPSSDGTERYPSL